MYSILQEYGPQSVSEPPKMWNCKSLPTGGGKCGEDMYFIHLGSGFTINEGVHLHT